MAKTFGPRSMLPVEKPILASFFRIYGYLLLVAGVIAALVAFEAGSDGTGALAPTLAAIGAFMSVGTLALLAFGVAQIIGYIGRIAVATEQTAIRALGQGGAVPATTPVRTATPVNTPAASKAAQSVTEETDAADSGAHCPHCNMRIRIATLRRGPNICPSCYQEFEVE